MKSKPFQKYYFGNVSKNGACLVFKGVPDIVVQSSRKIFTNILVLFLPIDVFIFQPYVQIMQIVVYWRNSDIFGCKSAEPRKNFKKPEQEGCTSRGLL